MTRPRPTAKQLDYQSWEFGVFVHFGIRTFYEGHRDFDGKPMPPEGFDPTELDCDQWAATAARAGARYMVMTAKHHDGFANWPSAYSDYTVAATPYKAGHGDVLREFTDACRRHDLKVGLYYSPAEVSPRFDATPQAYDDYFVNQVSELMSDYGPVHIVWFDGCGSEGHTYDWPRIVRRCRQLQPKLMIFNMGGDPDFRWVGNEAGIAPEPCWNTVDAVPFSIRAEADEQLQGQSMWLPAECDCRMRPNNWFYSEHDADTAKSVEELMGLYCYSVGRGCNLLINIGPDRQGLLPEPDASRLVEFGDEVRRRFGRPIARLSDFTREGDTWELTFDQPQLIDHVIAMEDLTDGEHVRRFAVSIGTTHQQNLVKVFEKQSMGHKAICTFEPVKAGRVRLEVTERDGPVTLCGLTAGKT